MFGAFCVKPSVSKPLLSRSEQGLAAATRPVTRELSFPRDSATRSLHAASALTEPAIEQHLSATSLSLPSQQANRVHKDLLFSSSDSAAGGNGDKPSASKATKRASRKAKEGQKDPASGSTDLRCVCGVGPKNEQLLLKIGLSSVDRLKEVYKVTHKSNPMALTAYLQVGCSYLKLIKHTSVCTPCWRALAVFQDYHGILS